MDMRLRRLPTGCEHDNVPQVAPRSLPASPCTLIPEEGSASTASRPQGRCAPMVKICVCRPSEGVNRALSSPSGPSLQGQVRRHARGRGCGPHGQAHSRRALRHRLARGPVHPGGVLPRRPGPHQGLLRPGARPRPRHPARARRRPRGQALLHGEPARGGRLNGRCAIQDRQVARMRTVSHPLFTSAISARRPLAAGQGRWRSLAARGHPLPMGLRRRTLRKMAEKFVSLFF